MRTRITPNTDTFYIPSTSLFSKGFELIRKSSCSHPLDELPFFYCKRVIAATHSYKFTALLQSKNCNKEISQIPIMIPSWFQACIYEKKFVITWQNHFQASIFSMIVSLFQGSTWSDSNVEDTVFISQHLLQTSIITSGLWLAREKLKSIVYLKKTILAFLFYRCLLFHRTSCINFCLKSTV